MLVLPQRINFVSTRIFSLIPCILLLTVLKAWEMSGRKAILLHQVSSLSKSASSDSSGIKKIYRPFPQRTLKAPALGKATSLPCAARLVREKLPWQNTKLRTTSTDVVNHSHRLIQYLLDLRQYRFSNEGLSVQETLCKSSRIFYLASVTNPSSLPYIEGAPDGRC